MRSRTTLPRIPRVSKKGNVVYARRGSTPPAAAERGKNRERGITRGGGCAECRSEGGEPGGPEEEAAPARRPPPADLHPAGRTSERRSCVRLCALSLGCGRTRGPGRRRGRVSAKFDLVAFPMLQQSEAALGAPGGCGAAAGQSGDSTLTMIIK